MIHMEHGGQFNHHGIAKVHTMISYDRSGYTKPCDNVIEEK